MRSPIPVVLMVISVISGCDGQPPADEQMLLSFSHQRQVFDQLRSELCALQRVQTIWVDDHGQPEISPDELKHFSALLAEIGAERVAVLPASVGKGARPCRGTIDVWTAGMLDSGDSKSWDFGDVPNGEDDLVLSSLEHIDFAHTVNRFPPPSSHGHRTYWRHIENDWWLQWDHWE